MAPPVSLKLQEHIIAWKYEPNMPISVIAQLANQCEKTVKNVLKTYWNYNQPINPFIQPYSHKCILDCDDLNYIKSILLAEPALFLDEIQDKLHVVQDVEVSISTLSHTFNCLAITHKAVAKEAMERNEHLHATWQVVMAQYDAGQLVFVDEARVDD